MATYLRGSEWRKWDLQVHTPFSALSNGFGSDFESYAKQLLTLAVRNKIAVVGIADYFSIEGYKKLKSLLRDRDKLISLVGHEIAMSAEEILFLPNVELRTSIIVKKSDGTDSRVNFHIIFSDKIDPNVIEEHFLHEIKFTAEANPFSADERWSLKLNNLEALGRKLKEQHVKFQDRSDSFIGMMNAVVHHEDVTKVLDQQQARFKEQCLMLLPADEDLSRCSWDGQGHLMRKVLIQKSHMLSSSNSGTRDFGLGKRHATQKAFTSEFKSLKPCVHSSDAHTFERLFEPDGKRYTWIKADPTFQGLWQLLNEPEERVFIGEMPNGLLRLAHQSTRITQKIAVWKSYTSPIMKEKWFDVEIPLNPELVAIIGNKGSGKSALADILGLLGNTPRYDFFSFLRQDRFRNPKDNKAKCFQASLTWADETVEGPISLDANPEPDAVEKIKYIPQNYLEEICNEIGLGKESRFYTELQQVIFSHVDDSERLGFTTLDELLNHRSEETHEAIELLIGELRDINKQIVSCEERLSSQYRKVLEAQLAEKHRELEAHEQARPKEKQKPEEDKATQEQSKVISELLEKRQAELKQIEAAIIHVHETVAKLAKRGSTAEKLLSRIQNLHRQIASVLSDTKQEFTDLGLEQDKVITIKIDTVPLEGLLKSINAEKADNNKQLDGDELGSLEQKRLATCTEIAELQAKLSAPQQEYQLHLQKMKEWEEGRDKILGTEESAGSIKHLEQLIKGLQELPNIHKRLLKQRDRKALEILREKQRLRSYFAIYYGAVQQFLSKHPLAANESFRLTFNVSVVQSGFTSEFLGRINQRKVGPFAGIEDGAAALRSLLDKTKFDSALGTLRFIHQLLGMMSAHEGREIDIKDQLKQGGSLQELYDYVFSLSYLSPIYNLQWDGKGLEQLSPGERGNLLLIFYLLVDRADIPLVIDQPEENLDNETVYKTLVPCIKDAKKRRQIVVVTHNPNLAVVCDAEQVIYAEIKKDAGNEVTYTSGSIEDPVINKKIVDILEGTRPAFDKRDDKYQ